MSSFIATKLDNIDGASRKPRTVYHPPAGYTWDSQGDRAMVTIFGRLFSLRSFRFTAFLLVLSSSNLALAGEIHEAVKANDLAKVRSLIKNSPDLVSSKDEDGFTSLHLAAANGYKEMADFLLANGADVNAKDNSQSTPLHQAVAAGGEHADLLELFNYP